MTKKRWTVEFSEEDWLSVELDVEKGKVTGLVLNYLAHMNSRIREVVRYDTDHGHLHKHRFWLDKNRQVTDLEDRENPSRDYGAAFNSAALDLRENGFVYRGRVERKQLDKGEKHETKEATKGSPGEPGTGPGIRSKGDPKS